MSPRDGLVLDAVEAIFADVIKPIKRLDDNVEVKRLREIVELLADNSTLKPQPKVVVCTLLDF